MLEVRGVVDAGRQHDDVRVFDSGGGRRAQRGEELVRIVADRAHPHRDEQLGQRLRHHPAVRDDVADARGHPHVVFEHPHLAVLIADEVDARHLDADAVRAVDAGGLAIEVLRRGDEPGGQHAVAHAVLATVRVVEERLECAHALLDPRLDPRPLVERDHAGDGIQREGSFLAGEVERHALREVRAGERLGASAQLLLGHLRERLIQLAIGLAGLRGITGMRRDSEHLVERGDAGRRLARRQRGAVAVEEITHATTLVRGVLPACFGGAQRPGVRGEASRALRECSHATAASDGRGPSVGSTRDARDEGSAVRGGGGRRGGSRARRRPRRTDRRDRRARGEPVRRRSARPSSTSRRRGRRRPRSQLFGTNDKIALLIGIGIVLVGVAALAGLIELNWPPGGLARHGRVRRRRRARRDRRGRTRVRWTGCPRSSPVSRRPSRSVC